MEPILGAYPGRPGADLGGALLAFGWAWLHVLVPAGVFAGALVVVARRADLPRGATFTRRLAHGAAAVSGLPPWAAGGLVLLVGAYLFAVQGFFWDVAWHIDVGRDEFLFSPPHVALLLGLGLVLAAGLVATGVATREQADVRWRVGRLRIPVGAAGLLVGGGGAVVAFGVDELWHWAYGLDVTMWSPPHLAMISGAALSTLSAWLLYAEAGGGRPWVRRHAPGVLAGVCLVGLSAWQLEFDLGVPQWQQGYHPVLVGLAAGFALTAARAALGRGGALLALTGFLLVRAGLLVLTEGVYGLSQPRLPLYLGAALAVEAAFALAERRGWSPRRTGLVAGAGVGTLGLAEAWAWTHAWGAWHPWQPGLAPMIALAGVAAVAAAVLGTGFGRATRRHAHGLGPGTVAAGLAVVLAALALPLPRVVPDAGAVVRTTPAGDGLVDVEVTITPPEAAEGADRFEVLAWQGGGRMNVPLEPVAGATYATSGPVPVDGQWKAIVRLADGAALGGIPIAMPADPAIGASEVPLVGEREQAFVADEALLLREAHDGPGWPKVVGYAYVTLVVGGLAAAIVGGAAALGGPARREAVDTAQAQP